MELTKEIIDEVVLAARDIDYGSITISIARQPSRGGRVVDIITEKRERYLEAVATEPGDVRYQKDKYLDKKA